MLTAEKNELASEIVARTGLKHVAIIMDGNRRWAKEHHLPSAVGHKKGVDALKFAITAAHRLNVKYLTVYAFSTENWNRKKEEIDFLMGLLAETMRNEIEELNQNNVKIKFIGDIESLVPSLKETLAKAEAITAENNGVHLQIAFNYGARNEMLNAVKNIAKMAKNGELSLENIDETTITENLYTKDIPDPDLLIRTGGEMRVSNYLLWQIAYSELLILDTYWPDFDEATFSDAVICFGERQRRYGG